MAVQYIIPYENIKVSDVRDTIGTGSSSLCQLCAKARSGGTGGYAFRINENNGSSGRLIEGATPYWNIWSNHSPGEWFVDMDGSLSLKLKKSEISAQAYAFMLSGFAGYKHTSVKPYLAPVSGDTIQINNGNAQDVRFKYCLGEVDWLNKIGAARFRGIIRSSQGNELSNFTGNISLISEYMTTLSFDAGQTQWLEEYLTTELYLIRNDYTEIQIPLGEQRFHIERTGDPIIREVTVINRTGGLYGTATVTEAIINTDQEFWFKLNVTEIGSLPDTGYVWARKRGDNPFVFFGLNVQFSAGTNYTHLVTGRVPFPVYKGDIIEFEIRP
ncbi:MAG: hypothetical protein PUB21_00725 [Bacteroidales bacterium]|nr:hypothetical protein [Bacteroidales bacterium]